jgi:hypothetical protein
MFLFLIFMFSAHKLTSAQTRSPYVPFNSILLFSLDLSHGIFYVYILVCGLSTKCVEFIWVYVVTDVVPYTDFIIKHISRK